MFKIICLSAIVLLCGAVVFAQTKSNPTVKFTSVYTDLNKDCKSAFTAKEEKEAESRGQDIPLKCKNVGIYYVYIYYSAWSSILHINNKRDDSYIQLAQQGLNFNYEKNKKLEWRLADGKPFAVILRVNEYDFPADLPVDASPYDDKYKTGETLVVTGLLGHEQIEYKVDAKLPDANEQARKLADEGF